MKKNILLLLVLAAAVAFVAWKLQKNKSELTAKAALSQVSRAHIPVEIVHPTMENLSTSLEAEGVFMPFKEMLVISETAGRVLEVFKDKGDWVNEGDLLAKVDDEMLQIELEATSANLAKLQKDRGRVANLIEGEAVSKSKIEEVDLGILAAEAKIKGLKKQISKTSLTAPMTGTIGLRFIERGSVIGPGIQVAAMANLQKLLLHVKVTEQDILAVKKGQTVQIKADVFKEKTFSGRVTNIALKADNTFNYDVEIEVANTSSRDLLGGMHGSAVFSLGFARQSMILPRRAIAGSLQDGKIFVVKNDSIAAEKTIEIGRQQGEKVEIRGGLALDEKVVLSGQSNLADGAKVKITN